jgi:hypothetical protein
MPQRRYFIAAGMAAAVVAVTGAAASGAAAKGGTDPVGGKPCSVVVKDGKSGYGADHADIAAKLGVTVDRLNTALGGAKKSLFSSSVGKGDHYNADRFATDVAASLGLPVERVKAALAGN